MALSINTKAKRMSAMNFSLGVGDILLPDPDGSIDGPDQQHLLDCYSANAFAQPSGIVTRGQMLLLGVE